MDDTTGHGTKCAAVAAGIQINGVSGVAYDASLLICKARALKEVIEALKYIEDIADKGTPVHVVSMSFTFRNGHHKLEECIDRITEKGIICVAATGNYGLHPISPVRYPARYKNVIAIGAHTSLWQRASFSPDHDDVDYTTLGVGVGVPNKTWSKSSLTSSNGTSMATPAVAGLIACILERHNNLVGVDKKDRIKKIRLHLNSLITPGNQVKLLQPHLMFEQGVYMRSSI